MSEYIMDPSWHKEKDRLDTQGKLYKAGSMRVLEALGINEGWRCAEIGGGTGSIAGWLCDQVGQTGQVVVTDIDTRFLEVLDYPNLEVRRHDIVAEPLEASTYDLVHARWVLMNLSARDQALQHMVAALRPGAWLLVEDFDLWTWGRTYPPCELIAQVAKSLQNVLELGGVDCSYGLKLAPTLAAAGLTNVQAEGYLPLMQFGTPSIEVPVLLLEYLRERLIEKGLVTQDDLDRAIATMRQPSSTVCYPPLIVAAWGQKT